MTPAQKIRREILLQGDWGSDFVPGPLDTPEQVDAAYERLAEAGLHWDAEEEFRSGLCETNIPCEFSRHYLAKSVARQMSDGTWVGWTYWQGGGKHGEPGEVPWMEHAYALRVAGEQVVVIRTFAKENDHEHR